MKTEPDSRAAAWFRELGPGDFEWDEGNTLKQAKHGVTPVDIMALVLGIFVVFVGRITEPEHEEKRWQALGQNFAGRHLALVFTRRGDRIRPISCRAMRPNERKFYDNAIENSD